MSTIICNADGTRRAAVYTDTVQGWNLSPEGVREERIFYTVEDSHGFFPGGKLVRWLVDYSYWNGQGNRDGCPGFTSQEEAVQHARANALR